MKIFIDDGHGGSDPGAVSFIKEADHTLAYALELGRALTYLGIEVSYSRTTDTTVSLGTRAALANQWGANYFVSVHFNAGGGVGIETYALAPGGQGEKLAHAVQSSLIQSTGMTNRGVKFANFQVLRDTNMPAILIEGGFVDSSDADKIKTELYKREYVKAVSKAICDFVGANWSDPYATQPPKPQPVPQPQPIPTGIPILGPENVTVEQCAQFIRKVNPNAPDLAPIYERIGNAMGIKWGYAFAQMIKETGYLKFGGDVKPEQNNFAGIGATGGVNGASFVNQEYGVAAHLQHLFAYASTQPLPTNILKVDPRFDLVKRGACPTWESLNGHWAVPGVGYGEDIVKIHDAIAKEIVSDSGATSLLKKILQLILDYFKGVN